MALRCNSYYVIFYYEKNMKNLTPFLSNLE